MLSAIPALAWAQAGFYLTPKASFSEVYDDNIFNTTSDGNETTPPPVAGEPQPQPTPRPQRQDDFISRGGAGLKGGYQSLPFTLLGGYELEAEAFADHSEQSTAPSTQRALLESSYATSERLKVSFEGHYVDTKESRQVNAPAAETAAPVPTTPSPPTVGTTALETRRARSQLWDLGPAIDYQFDPLTRGNSGFTYSHSRQVGAATSDTYIADALLSRSIDPRTRVEVGYSFQHFRFENPAFETQTPTPSETPPPSGSSTEIPRRDEVDSHTVFVGGHYDLSPLTSIYVRGGPRFSEGNVDPDAAAEITHKLERGTIGARYARTLTTAVGSSGTVDSQGVSAYGTYDILEFLTTNLTLSFYHNSDQNSDADVYRVAASATYRLNEWLSLVGSYEFSYQNGTLVSVPGSTASGQNDIRHNVVIVSIQASKPYRID